jgi:hypothetical protein
MSDKNTQTHRDTNLDANDPDVRPADQAEGERGDKTSVTVKRTPGSAEGERNPSDQNKDKP